MTLLANEPSPSLLRGALDQRGLKARAPQDQQTLERDLRNP